MIESRVVEKNKKIKEIIVKHLKAMREDLVGFEITTHTHLTGESIYCFCRDLEECWDKPCAYRLSNLQQSLDKFLGAQK